MEEDLKILEKLKDKKINISGYRYSVKWFELDKIEKQAIDHIIQAYKDQQAELEKKDKQIEQLNALIDEEM